MTESLAGNLLVASTITDNPIVQRSVCLLVHHGEDGAIGVMLNRPLQPNPQQLLTLFADQEDQPVNRLPSELAAEEKPETSEAAEAAAPDHGGGFLHFGGPLSGPVVAIHASSEHAEAETGPGIYVAAQKQHLEHLVRHRTSPYRLIVGHLGWSAEQLREEIARGYWHVLPATADVVFAGHEEMWARLIRRGTASSLASWIGTDDDPDAAALN